MSTIQKITGFNSVSPIKLKQNNSNNTIIEPKQDDEFISSPSFKGGMKTTTPNTKKGIAALFTAALAAIGLIEKKPKTEEERVKIEYNKTKQKNPKFIKNLEKTKQFSQAAIVTLAKYKEEDPDFAFELSKVFRTYNPDYYWNLDDSEYLAQKFKEDPDLVGQYKYRGPEDAVKILRARDLAPGFADSLYKDKGADEALEFAKIYSKNPQAAMELSQNKTFHISASEAKIIAEDWDKNKAALDAIIDAAKTAFKKNGNSSIYYGHGNIVDLISTYNLYPKEVISMILDGHSASRIKVLAEAKAKAPLYYAIGITDLTENRYQLFKNTEEIKEFALNAQKLGKQLSQIKKKRGVAYGIQHADHFDLIELKPIVEKFKDHPEALERIIRDGRSKLNIAKLADLYINNPKKTITDNMVKAALDPIGKFFLD